jgi:glycerophosphoryl diester phosphodiesterase
MVRRVDAVQLPSRKFGIAITTPRTIRRFQAAGVEVHAWTINDPKEMRALLKAGIDGLVTDRSDLAVELLRPTS